MKKLSVCLYLIFFALVIKAQGTSSKQLVYVNSFTGFSYISKATLRGIESSVKEGLVASNRIEVRDFLSDSEFLKEYQERTADANISDKDYAFQLLNKRGAKWVIDGVVTHYNSVYRYNSEGKGYYDGKIDVALQITDVSTGVVSMSKTISTDRNLTGLFTELGTTIGSSAKESLSNAVALLKYRAKDFAEEFFQLEGYILEIDEVKKDEARTVYINMGTLSGVKKGDIFEVFETKVIAGRTVKNKIGELKVLSVHGEDISLCKVKDGGEEILKKMQNLDEGEKILIKSRMKKKPLGGLL